MEKIEKSKHLMQHAGQVIPGGVNSPVRAFKSVGGIPRVIARGEGPYLIDIDGNRYLDFCCSWGPLILGHGDKDVVRAVTEQVSKGTTFGAPTEIEYLLAQFIVEHVPHVEKIRFVSSGTEAVMSAVRLARGFTGRDLILKFEGCYHGHADYLLVKSGSGLATFGQPSSAGVPTDIINQTATLPLDDEQRLEDFFKTHGGKLAAVIIEGIPANNGLLIQRTEFIHTLRKLTEKYGVVLIFDEVITGFRLGVTGAAGYYGITPDLVTYGKIVGGGMPVGAFGGRTDIMDKLSPIGPVYQAGTLSGNPVAMTAGYVTLQKLVENDFYPRLEKRMNAFTAYLSENIQDIPAQVVSIASIFWFVFQESVPRAAHQIDQQGIERFNTIHGALLDAGIYYPPSGYEVGFISVVHTEEILRKAAKTTMSIMKEHLE